MRGGFVACLDGDDDGLRQAADLLRWHDGDRVAKRTGRLSVIAGVDPADGPKFHEDDSRLMVAHGASAGTLSELQRGRGRFAAVVWDGTTLRASRDPIGLAPLFYRLVDRAMWLSTEVGPLLAMGTPAPDLEALAAKAAFAPIEDRTGWTGVHRVLPGMTIEVNGTSVSSTRYWDPARLVGTYSGTLAQAQSEFRERFRAAVQACWAETAGIMVSGGLDSAAVAVAAAPGVAPPHLVHICYSTVPGTDELAYAKAVADQVGARLNVVEGHVDPWDPSDDLRSFGIPYDRLPFGMDDAALGYLAANGITVALDGHDGDGVLGVSGAYWGELAIRGEVKLLRELAAHYGVATVARRVASELLPPEARLLSLRSRGQAHTYMQRLEHYFDGPLREQIVAEDLDRWARPGRWWRLLQTHPLQPRATVSFERKELEAARFGIDMRHPFADRDLVEFLISLPCAVKICPDRPKALLRDSLADLLPPLVRDRSTKSDYMAVIRHRIGVGDCLDRVRGSGIQFPHIDYDRFFRDASSLPEAMPAFFALNMARLHTFAALARG